MPSLTRILCIAAGMAAVAAQSINVYFFSDDACANQITDITLGSSGVCYDTSSIIAPIFSIPYSSISVTCGGGVANGTMYASVFSDGSQCDADLTATISTSAYTCYGVAIPGTSVGLSIMVDC